MKKELLELMEELGIDLDDDAEPVDVSVFVIG